MFALFFESLQPVAFILGPLLVLLLLIFAFIRGRQARDWLFPAAIPLALLSVTGPAAINGFVYIGLFRVLATGETVGGAIIDAQGAAASRGLMNGVIGLSASLCAAGIVYLIVGVRKPPSGAPPHRPAGGFAGSGMILAVSAVTLLAGLLVWLHLGTIDLITAVTAPVRAGVSMDAIGSDGIAAIAARLSRNLQLLLLGGLLLSVASVAVAALVVVFQRRPAAKQTLVAAGIAFAAVLGAGWTAVMLKADMRDIDRIAAARDQTDMIKNTPAPEYPWLTQPPPPPPPPPPPASQLVAPTKIPGEITPDNTSGGAVAGVAGGIPGGVAGGVVGGILGGISEAPPPPPPPATAPLRVRAPEKLKDVQPVYPELARRARVEDIIMLDAVIGPDGKVQEVRVLKGHPLLVQAAIDAVRQWEFTPTLVNGKAAPVVTAVSVTFKLY